MDLVSDPRDPIHPDTDFPGGVRHVKVKRGLDQRDLTLLKVEIPPFSSVGLNNPGDTRKGLTFGNR